MPDWTIDPLRNHSKLIPALATLHQAEWHAVHPDMSVTDWENEFFWHILTSSPTTLVATDADQQLLGSASLVKDDMEGLAPYSPWLANVLVLPAARGQGIGAALIDAIAVLALAQGHPELFLFTSDQQHFYLQRGWIPLEDRIHHGVLVSLMRKPLT